MHQLEIKIITIIITNPDCWLLNSYWKKSCFQEIKCLNIHWELPYLLQHNITLLSNCVAFNKNNFSSLTFYLYSRLLLQFFLNGQNMHNQLSWNVLSKRNFTSHAYLLIPFVFEWITKTSGEYFLWYLLRLIKAGGYQSIKSKLNKYK